MGEFEETQVYSYEHPPLTWDCFIDDIFMIWTWGREKLEIFIITLIHAIQA